MQLILRTLLRTFQAQIAKKIRTFGSGSASAQKNDVLTKKKECICNPRKYSFEGQIHVIAVPGFKVNDQLVAHATRFFIVSLKNHA